MERIEEPSFGVRLNACIAEARASSGVPAGVASLLEGIGHELLAKQMPTVAVRKHALALIEEGKRHDVVPPA